MVLLLLAGAASPGPSLALVSRTAVQGGIKVGLLASLGHGLAISIYAFLAVGVTAFSKSDLEQFSQIIQVIAVIFLCYLGTRMVAEGMKKKFKPTAFAEDAEGNEITDLDERKRISDEAREAMPMNKGGEVPGQGDKDTVPAMLTPGEFVLTKEAVKKVGADTLYGMNAAAGGVGKSNDVPRGSSGKPMKKKSTVQTMMDMGGLNPINNISKSMNNVTNNISNSNISKSNVTNNIDETMNMSGGGMTKNMSYMGGGGMTKNTSYMNSGGMVTNNIGGTSNVQYMKLGGMVKNFISNSPQARFLKFVGNQISKTPQARALRFAGNQIKKSPVKPPIAKALKALKGLGMKNTPPSPMATGGDDTSVNEIPTFSVIAGGGRAKEQTLGIRR